MSMKLLTGLLIICLLTFPGCKRDCGCTPPPNVDTKWRVTRIFGGFGPAVVNLNNEQLYSILTLKANGNFECKNTQTGVITNGVLTINTSSPSQVQYIFTPALPVYHDNSFILVSNTDGSLVLFDGTADGYTITFTRQP